MKTWKLRSVLACFVVISLAVFGIAACSSGSSKVTETVATPTATPVAGPYETAQNVTLSTTTAGAVIRYTLDGSEPTATTGTVYSTAIPISATTTIRAIAIKDGMNDSGVLTAYYTIDLLPPGQVARPAATPPAGSYTAAQNVTLASATEGAAIRYTINGSTPSRTNGTVYSTAITISATTTLRAIAYKTDMNDSDILIAEYTINTTPPPGPGGGALSGTVTIAGLTEVGQTLTAVTTSLGGSGAITYVWTTVSDLTDDTEIPVLVGSNSSKYPVEVTDLNRYITVTVTRANNSGSVTSQPTEKIAGATSLTSIATVKTFLAGLSFTPTTAVPVTLNVAVPSVGTLAALLEAIGEEEKYVELNLTSYTGNFDTSDITTPKEAVDGKTYVVSLTLPDAINIGDGITVNRPLSGFTNLSSVTLSGVTKVNRYAFYECASLTEVNLPTGITEIGDSAFVDCTSLAEIDLPATVTVINGIAFDGCTKLAKITLPAIVTNIYMYAFKGCTSLKLVTCLGETPPNLGGRVFEGTPADMQIKVPYLNIQAYKDKWGDADPSLTNKIGPLGSG